MPAQGSILFSIADRDKAEALPLIKGFAGIGYRLYATEGTAAMIQSLGLPVTMITKKLSEGHPNVIDVINDHTVNGIVNTVTGSQVPLKDGFRIRRAAVEKHIPCFTSLDTIKAVLKILQSGDHNYNALPLPEYRRRKKA